MSAYSSYHSPASFDAPSHAHIPPISTINRQPYNDDSTSLPPMHTSSSDASPHNSSLMRDSHGTYQANPSSSASGHGISHFVPQQQSFQGGSSVPSAQHSLYASANYSSAAPVQAFSHMSSPSSASQSNGYGQQSLPPVTSALYGASIDPSPLNGYGSASAVPMRASHYQQEDIGLDGLAARRARRNIGSGISNDGSMAASGALAGTKNADGKYPCQVCNKTYQHQKHLKRHNLRHTGERPYRCHLCHETFCRSDILKRHFAKCSIRRGNPEGITHLTHAQDHLKKSPANTVHSAPDSQSHMSASSNDTGAPARAAWSNEGATYAHLSNATQQSVAGVNTGSDGSSRSSSVIPPGSSGSGADDRRHHSAASHTLPPIHTSLEASAHDPMTYNYDQQNVYSRNGYGQNDSGTEQGFYQQMPTTSAPFMMQHSQAYALPGHSGSYNAMTHTNPSSNGHWMNESAFHANHHDALMYSGS